MAGGVVVEMLDLKRSTVLRSDGGSFPVMGGEGRGIAEAECRPKCSFSALA